MEIAKQYLCDNGQMLTLKIMSHDVNINGKKIFFEEMPFLWDELNGKLYLTELANYHLENKLREIEDSEVEEINVQIPTGLWLRRFENFDLAEAIKFEYSALEYYAIPGLLNSKDLGYLTPIYFNQSVLIKYIYNPDYRLEIISPTYGKIKFRDEWDICFGVNKYQDVIFWLGDISSLPLNEQCYLKSENKKTSFEIHSEFYNAEILAAWTEPSLEKKVFNERRKLAKKFNYYFGDDLFNFENEILKIMNGAQKPIFWEKHHISPIIISLNSIYIESLNNELLKKVISNYKENFEKKDIEGKKGMKLLEIFLIDVLNIKKEENLLCPFFVLYDFRLILAHVFSDAKEMKTKESICDRLKINRSANYECIYNKLLERLYISLYTINMRLREFNDKYESHRDSMPT